jgi:excisionase family DNA binding protein
MNPSIPDPRTELLSELQSLTENSGKLLTTAQVALLFGVGDRTIRVWAGKNWIPAIRNPSGHWKFSATEVFRTYKKGIHQEQLRLGRTFHREEET